MTLYGNVYDDYRFESTIMLIIRVDITVNLNQKRIRKNKMNVVDKKKLRELIARIKNEAIIKQTDEVVRIATGYSLGCSGKDEKLVEVQWRGIVFPKCIERKVYVTLGFISIDCMNFHRTGFKDWMTPSDRKELLEAYPGPMESWGYKFLLGEEVK